MEEEEAHGSDGLGDGGGLDEVSSPPQAEVSQAPQAQHASSLYAAEETTARAQTNNQLVLHAVAAAYAQARAELHTPLPLPLLTATPGAAEGQRALRHC